MRDPQDGSRKGSPYHPERGWGLIKMARALLNLFQGTRRNRERFRQDMAAAAELFAEESDVDYDQVAQLTHRRLLHIATDEALSNPQGLLLQLARESSREIGPRLRPDEGADSAPAAVTLGCTDLRECTRGIWWTTSRRSTAER